MAEKIPKKTKKPKKRTKSTGSGKGNQPMMGAYHSGFRVAGRPPKFETPAQMEKAIDAYFAQCESVGHPLTITGLALALNMSRQALLDYAEKDAFLDTVKRAKLVVENYAEFLALAKGHAGAIFALKNFGWKDKTEVYQETNFTQMGRVTAKMGDGTVKELSFNVGKKRTK